MTRVHRWTGLAIAVFVIVLAATGSIIAFSADLQRILAPEHYIRPPRSDAEPLDWVILHKIAEETSGGIAATLPLNRGADEAVAYYVVAAQGRPPLGFDAIGLDPYTGKEIYRARIGDLRDGKTQIIPFIENLHYTLALGAWGAWLLGVAAAAWTIDCFVGFYLTLPAGPRSWWRHWRKAWTIKMPVPSQFRLHFDLHRASGLWLWPMLFIFAWSGVAFNLPAVYAPVMHAFTGYSVETTGSRPDHHGAPALNWESALAAARLRSHETLPDRGVTIERERELRYGGNDNIYALGLRTSRDRSDSGANTWVKIDGDTGALINVEFPDGGRLGNSIDYWLAMLHVAAVFGLPYRIFVSVVGIFIVILTITGVLIWMKKKFRRLGRA